MLRFVQGREEMERAVPLLGHRASVVRRRQRMQSRALTGARHRARKARLRVRVQGRWLSEFECEFEPSFLERFFPTCARTALGRVSNGFRFAATVGPHPNEIMSWAGY